MSELETTPARRVVWPCEHYSGPTPAAVLPKGVTFGCGLTSVLVLLVVFAGGIYLAGGGIVDLMDMTFGMSMGELRGMYTKDVTAAQKAELEKSIEELRKNVREQKVPVARLDPVLQTMRKTIADRKVDPAEAEALAAAARKANRR